MVTKFLRSLFRLVGILLLISMIPQRGPWNPANIWTSGEIYHNVTVRLAILNWRLSASGVYIFLLALLGMALLIGASPLVRKNVVDLIRSRKRLIPVLVPLVVFLLALYPSRSGLPMVLYLILSGLGLLFTLFGIYPALIWLRRWLPIELFRVRVWKPISGTFYGIRPRYFMILVFVVPFILTNICSYFIFDHVPRIQDNIDQVFHAKIFLSGHLTAESHKYREFFDFLHNVNNGRWYSEYPPAHTFMIMLCLIMGVPWMTNPLLGSASIVLFYLIGKELYDEKTGRLAALLGILSPFIIFMSSGFFSHGTSLFYTALFMLFFIKTVRSPKLRYPLIAGISLGVALNARILTAPGIALPYAFYAIYLMVTRRRDYLLRFAVMLMGFMLLAGVLAGFNYLTNGHPLLTGYEVAWGKEHHPGFGHSAWGPPHTPKKGLMQNLNNLNALNKYLFEWCIPCTFFVMLLFVGGRQNRWDYMLISSVFSLSFVYFFYWFQGWAFGPRFMYESTCPLILLTAKGIMDTPDIMRERFHATSSKDQIRYLLNLVIAFCSVVAVSANVPQFVRMYSNNYWGVDTEVQQAVEREKITNAVVFVGSYYGSVLALNSPMLDSEIIYARDLTFKNKLMMEYYPDRRYYLAYGSTYGSDIQEIFSHYYDSVETPVIPNSDFEEGILNGWSSTGDVWDITDRDRGNREGQFHAESLVRGERATGVLTSSKFKITGDFIKLYLNGWNRDPRRPNQCFLKDAETHEILRIAFPPNQDEFVARFWDVSDLVGREVYLMVVDKDDDGSGKGGWAWMGVDAVTQLHYYDGEETPVIPNSDFEEGKLSGWSFSGDAWDITDRSRGNREGGFHAESLVGGDQATGVLLSSKFKIEKRFIKFLLSGWNRDPLRPNQCFLKDAATHEILRTASPPNEDAFLPKFWDVSDLVGREVCLMIVDNDDDSSEDKDDEDDDDDTSKKTEQAWIGIDAVTQLQ